MSQQRLPRGVRLGNPGNIRHGDKWQGLASVQPDRDFCSFRAPVWGIRALARTLITYQDKHGIRTIEGVIWRWAPPSENDTESYIRHVCQLTEMTSRQTLNLQSYEHLRPLVEAIIRHENGKGPLRTMNSWYSRELIDEGLRLAGVVKQVPEVAKVPVNTETVGATTSGTVGVLQLADVMPAVMDATTQAEIHITSGQWVRIAFGLVLVGVAVAVAWGQVRKHQQGLV